MNIIQKISGILLGIILFPSVRGGENTLHDFETGTDGFGVYASGGLTATIDTSGESAYSGQKSLLIEITNAGSGNIQLVAKTIDVIPGDDFAVRFYMRSSEDRTVILKSQYNLEGGGIKVFWEKQDVQVTTGWKLMDVNIIVPETIDGKKPLSLFVGFIELNVSGATGLKYYIDHYEIEYSGDPPDPGTSEVYYVSPIGLDSGTGSQQDPFRTISKAAELAGAGDTIFIREGIYCETVIPAQGSPEAPLVFMAYPGEKPVIMGTDTLSGWQLHEGSVYYSGTAGAVSQLFYDGKQMTGARWPDLTSEDLMKPAYARMDQLVKAEQGGTTTLIDAELSGLPNLAGSRIWMQGAGMWGSMSEAVLSHEGNSIQFINTQPGDVSSLAYPAANSYFFFYGGLSLLDKEKEWYYDKNASMLYFHPPGGVNPGTHTVLARTRQNGFLLQKDHVVVSGIEFFAAGMEISGSSNIVENCSFLYPCPFFDAAMWRINSGIILRGQGNTIRKCEVAYSWGAGIVIDGTRNPDSNPFANQRIENCLVHEMNWMGAYGGAVDLRSHGLYVGGNTIFRTGRSGISGVMKRSLLEKNHIYDMGYLSHDLGAFYIGEGGVDGGDKDSLVICRNYTHLRDPFLVPSTSIINSIYLDVTSSNTLVFNNITQGTRNGVQMNGMVVNNMVFNNIMYKVSHEAMHQYDQGDPSNIYVDVRTYNNISDNSHFLGTDKKNNAYRSDFAGFRLAGPGYGDFRPLPGSPVIDAGIEVEGFTDYTNGQPDLGPYEFGGDTESSDWFAGVTWSPVWNSLPQGAITIEVDSLYPSQYIFSVINDNDSDGWIMRYDWDFGDGKKGYGKTVNHGYEHNGEHTISLTLRDNLSGISVIQENINIDLVPVHFKTFMDNEGAIRPLPGAKIMINDELETHTDSLGNKTVLLAPGAYSYHISHPGYYSRDSNFEILNEELNLSDTLRSADYQVLFTIRDVDTGKPLSGCQLDFNGQQLVTDELGEASLSGVSYGIYTLSATADGYTPAIFTGIEILSDTSLVFNLTRDYQQVSVKVIDRSGGDPVYRAEIRYGEILVLTNPSGEASPQKIGKGYWVFSITHKDYFTLTDSILIPGDTNLVFELTATWAGIHFQVNHSEGPLMQIPVIMNGLTILTGPTGLAIFPKQQARQDYIYRIEKQGYVPVQDTFRLEIDTIIRIKLEQVTGSLEIKDKPVRIFPNPVSGLLFIDLPHSEAIIRLVGMESKLLMTRKIFSGLNELDLTSFAQGVYYINVQTHEFSKYFQLVIER